MGVGNRRATRCVLPALAVVLVSVLLLAACASSEEVPPLERRAQEINKSLMCPVCPGESIDQSQHPLAVLMRGIVAEKVGQGWSNGQIKEYIVEGYGARVLLEPPRRGSSLIVWLVPPMGLAVAGVALFLALRVMLRSRDDAGDEAGDAARLSEEERAAYFRRIEAALADETMEGAGEAVARPSDTGVGDAG